MIIKSYEEVFSKIEKIYSNKKNVNFMLTGGNSIKNFYNFLSKKINKKILDKTKFFLSDERVFENKKNTNFYLVKKFLFKKVKYQNIKLLNMYDSKKNINENLNFLEKNLKKMDIIFLSYGKDGHIASIFPNIKPIIKNKKVSFIYNADNEFNFRITVNKSFINHSKIIFLFFLGEEKKKIFYSLKKKNFRDVLIKNFIPVVI